MQLGLLWLLSETPHRVVSAGTPDVRLKVLDFGQTDPGLARHFDVVDPSAFALPSGGGGAGPDWRRVAPGAGAATTGAEPARWLRVDPGWFGGTAAVVSVPSVHRGAVDKPAAGPTGPVASPVPVQGRTVVETDGALAARGLAGAVDAVSLAHSNLLGVTEVQVAVEADGSVFSAVLLQSAGWDAADERGLALARGARFKPLPGASIGQRGGTVWGRMRFRWHTVQPEPAPGGGT